MPYGLWSEAVAEPSMQEHVEWIERLEEVLQTALDRFGLALREDTSLGDLACALASAVEGVWLNQCLTRHHPTDPSAPVAEALRRSGRLLWRGAIGPGR